MEKLSADEEHQHYMQPPARHKSSFLYDQLPSTPEVGSEFMHNDSPFVEANMTEETSQARRHEEDNNINYMKGNRIGMLKKKNIKKGEGISKIRMGHITWSHQVMILVSAQVNFRLFLLYEPQVVEIRCTRRTRYYQKLGLPLNSSIGSFEGVVGIDEFVGDWFNRIPMKEYSQI